MERHHGVKRKHRQEVGFAHEMFYIFDYFLSYLILGCIQTSWMSHLPQEIEEVVLSPVPQEDLLKWECYLPMWDLWKRGLHQRSDPSEPRADKAQRWQTVHVWVLPEQVCYRNVPEWTQEQETWGELKGGGRPKEDVPLWPLWKATDKQDETSGSHRGYPRGQAGLQVPFLWQDLHLKIKPPDPRRLVAHRGVALPMWLLPENVCPAKSTDSSQGESTSRTCRTLLCCWGCWLCAGDNLSQEKNEFNVW